MTRTFSWTRLGLGLSLATVVSLGSPSIAHAEDDTLEAASNARFKEGMAFVKKREYEQARASFLQALVVSPDSPSVLLNLALAEQASGHPLEALGHVKAYVANPRSDPNKVAQIEKTVLAELWAATGHVRITADRGEPVTLDGKVKLGNAPFAEPIDVMPGHHTLAAAAGPQAEVTVAAGETRDVDLASPKAAPGPPATSGGGSDFTAPPPTSPTPPGNARYLVSGGLVLAGVVGLGVGLGFNIASSSNEDDALALQARTPGNICAAPTPTCTEYKSGLDDAADQRTFSRASFIVGGALAAAGVVTFLVWPSSRSSTSSGRYLVPLVTPTHAGLAAGASF